VRPTVTTVVFPAVVVGVRDRLRRLTGRGAAACEPDPFEALRLQARLGVVAGRVRRMETSAAPFAKAQRVLAICAAYDDLLAEACRVAGVPVLPDTAGREDRRWYAEQQLTERGWSW
jgi:hypothetical protein